MKRNPFENLSEEDKKKARNWFDKMKNIESSPMTAPLNTGNQPESRKTVGIVGSGMSSSVRKDLVDRLLKNEPNVYVAGVNPDPPEESQVCPVCGTENNHCHSAWCVDHPEIRKEMEDKGMKCEQCAGTGTMLDGIEDNGDPCPDCNGTGERVESRDERMTKIDILFELLKQSTEYKLKSFAEFAEAYEGETEEVVLQNIDRVEREHENLGGWL